MSEHPPTQPGTPAPRKHSCQGNTQLVYLLSLVFALPVAAFVAWPTGCGYPLSAKVQEGVNLSNPARTALGIACSERDLHNQTNNTELGLALPHEYGPVERRRRCD